MTTSDHGGWTRPLFTPGGGDASVLWYIFGAFPAEFAPSRSKYRIAGDLGGLRVSRHAASEARARAVLRQPQFARFLADEAPELALAVHAAPSCLLVHGTIVDPPDLRYLRDAMGMLAYGLDVGGVAVLDAFRLKWWSREDLGKTLFEPDDPAPLEQTVLLSTPDEGGAGTWLHTRGMQKFGRPDLSVRAVPDKRREPVVEMMGRFVAMMAAGARVAEGQQVKMDGLPAGMTCHHGGSLDDPEFNNVHLELRWGAPRLERMLKATALTNLVDSSRSRKGVARLLENGSGE